MRRRILIAVTHLLGVGHLARAAALARAFARAGHQATLVSGGLPAPLVSTAAVNLIQIPPVRTRGVAFRTLLDGADEPVTAERLAARQAALAAAVERARPEAVITELFPFGRRVLTPEFMALIAAARALEPRPLVLASIRDILVASTKMERMAETHRQLHALYDGVLVHGDPSLLTLDASWPVDEGVRPLLRYTGYVDEGEAADGIGPEGAEFVVSGGSSGASLPLLRTATAAATHLPDRPWRVLAGAGVSDAQLRGLRAEAPANVVVERARSDFRALLTRAALSVSQAGYNTVVDLLRAGPRTLLVPFEGGRETEQRLRADSLAARGLATVLPEAELSATNLARTASRLLAGPRPAAHGLRLDGAAGTVSIVEGMLEAAARTPLPLLRERDSSRSEQGEGLSSSHAATSPLPDGLRPFVPPPRRWEGGRPLDTALRRAADSGVTLDLWWRDDDAVGATPALERLLGMAWRQDVPLALAVTPAVMDSSLPARLAETVGTTVLVHGFAHASHAPAGEKKTEFGPHRLPDRMAGELQDGLHRILAAFPGRALPVLVPPWNRIAPSLIPTLPALGYLGLSTFGRRSPSPGLIQVNTHLDPIDWRGTRGLADEDRLEAELARAIDTRLAGTCEPIGLLTHHLAHDEAVWSWCERLLERLLRSPAIRFHPTATLFAPESLPPVTEP